MHQHREQPKCVIEGCGNHDDQKNGELTTAGEKIETINKVMPWLERLHENHTLTDKEITFLHGKLFPALFGDDERKTYLYLVVSPAFPGSVVNFLIEMLNDYYFMLIDESFYKDFEVEW